MLKLNLLGRGDQRDFGQWLIGPQSLEYVAGLFLLSLMRNSSIEWSEDKAIVVSVGSKVRSCRRRNRQCHALYVCQTHAVV